ncbi:hypothetical protein CLV98_11164 [Dyadobacter jejuensis]|uniref:Uncharacterized protein n=1 Tax=Dyadobacter jejuensis TaxID=1082580 RepID=A0A316AI74_9BACT|nr:hypothetical protein CLV98_11164 [Dyadobacter jejuensis]
MVGFQNRYLATKAKDRSIAYNFLKRLAISHFSTKNEVLNALFWDLTKNPLNPKIQGTI